ncbi:MAG TPA: hypothetical protein PLV92_10230, partial [Pirellulaceae bacterium]|nr:hypothetical protein [Pirellulaceae bacterium]
VDDAQEAIGFVLSGAGKPVVVCAVDWTGLLNSAHVAWRTALAEAAGTTPDRVAVQCVHQHNAPFACLDAQKIVAAQGDLPAIVDVEFFERCLQAGRAAVKAAVAKARPLTHIATGQAKVLEVASNRRFLGPDGKIQFWRGSATKDAKLQELPEGLIDPWLKTVAFYEGDKKVVACHYYATHPMSYYGDGRASSEFVGLARKKRQGDEPDTTHIYFTGCSGNIAAGKYNDGTPAARERLTSRMYDGISASEKELIRQPVERVAWRTAELLCSPNPVFNAEKIEAEINKKSNAVVARNRPAYTLAFIRRCEQRVPIVLSALHINQATLLHLPAESFLEYQLDAQKAAPNRFVATAAYGDGGPWYIPTRDAYPQGGYEVGVAFSSSESDARIHSGVGELF